MKVKVFASRGQKTTDLEIPGMLDIKINHNLIAQAVQRNMSNRRRVIAFTKDRGEVSGGGAKPFRQKGTGRARAGSSRSPIWIGGGVTFGPRKRNFSKVLPRKMLQKSILMALAEKLKNNRLIVVSEFKFPKVSTKQIQQFLEKLPFEEGKILIVLAKTCVNLELSVANLPYIKIILVQNLNLFDLLKYDYLLTDTKGLEAIFKVFLRRKGYESKNE